MKALLLTLIITSLLTGCDSPMNHRISEGPAVATQNTSSLSFSQLQLSAEVQWLIGPIGSLTKNNHLLVIVRDSKGLPTSIPNGLNLNFYATMPSMGHPLDDAGFFEQLDTGIYLNKSIHYNMGGEWKNELWITDNDFNVKDKVSWLVFL